MTIKQRKISIKHNIAEAEISNISDDSKDPQLNPTINTTQKKQNHQLQ